MNQGTMVKIDSSTVGPGGTSAIQFNSIPQTYDDLLVIASGRSTRTGFPVDDLVIRFNGSSSSYASRRLYAVGTGVSNDTPADIRGFVSDADSTADAFGSNFFYITNYRTSGNKVVMVDGAGETNAVNAGVVLLTGQWADSSPVTSITLLANNGNLLQYSTATLYGITRVPTSAKATGGIVSSDSTYWYHAFTSSGVFTPTQSINADILVVAGGGGSGYGGGGGGGAGGLLGFTSQALTATNYTITVGAGGSGGTGGAATQGSSSQFGGLTVAVGGGFGGNSANALGAGSGGSGGGASGRDGVTINGTGTVGQGNDGGDGLRISPNADEPAGGGGGATQAGGTATSSSTGKGGDGSSAYSSWGLATLLGQNVNGTYWFAGGGAGGKWTGPTPAGVGGNGGGGSCPIGGGNPGIAGQAFTGGGASGGFGGGAVGGNGGSGVVIIRYAK